MNKKESGKKAIILDKRTNQLKEDYKLIKKERWRRKSYPKHIR